MTMRTMAATVTMRTMAATVTMATTMMRTTADIVVDTSITAIIDNLQLESVC